MDNKKSKITGPGVSDPQGPAGCRSGPGLHPSSSDDGPTTRLPAGFVAQLATAVVTEEENEVVILTETTAEREDTSLKDRENTWEDGEDSSSSSEPPNEDRLKHDAEANLRGLSRRELKGEISLFFKRWGTYLERKRASSQSISVDKLDYYEAAAHNIVAELCRRRHRLARHAAELSHELAEARRQADDLSNELDRIKAERARGWSSPPRPPSEDCMSVEGEVWRAETAGSRSPTPLPIPRNGGGRDDLIRSIMSQVGDMIDRKLEKVIKNLTRASPQSVAPVDEVGIPSKEGQAPPSDSRAEEDSWATAVKRGKEKGGAVMPPPEKGGAPDTPLSRKRGKREGNRKIRKKKKERIPAPPSSSAVVLTVEGGSVGEYREVLKMARERISLERDVGVPSLGIRRTRAGGVIFEIPGDERAERADKLAGLLRQNVGGERVRVVRPARRADLRVGGLDDSATPEEVAALLAELGGCGAGDIRIGSIRRSPTLRGVVWASCPVAAAIRAAQKGEATMGWARVTIELLPARPERCFRCLEVGHLRVTCTSAVDRGSRCFRCGSRGHGVAACVAPPRCPLCADLGRGASHVLGGTGCVNTPLPKKRDDGRNIPVLERDSDPRDNKVGKGDGVRGPSPLASAGDGASEGLLSQKRKRDSGVGVGGRAVSPSPPPDLAPSGAAGKEMIYAGDELARGAPPPTLVGGWAPEEPLPQRSKRNRGVGAGGHVVPPPPPGPAMWTEVPERAGGASRMTRAVRWPRVRPLIQRSDLL